MRADRLISLIMLLQTRGRMSAQQLAEELEVSVRTIYRDMEALSMAGVPVYAERGPSGGCGLVDGYQTKLTGLTTGELDALLVLSVPKPLLSLGLGDKAKAALLKLVGASPRSAWPEERRVHQRIHLDSTWWFQGMEPTPHLETIKNAVWGDQELRIVYESESQGIQLERVVEPYALVAKAGIWYVVCWRNHRMRVHRVSSIIDAARTGSMFRRTEDFDLEAFWEGWCDEYERTHSEYRARVKAKQTLIPALKRHFGSQVVDTSETPGDDWVELTLPFENLSTARTQISRYGSAMIVLSPAELRLSIADYARQIAALYGEEVGIGTKPSSD